MSIEKSELKALFANNLGADFEDRVEALQREFHQLSGAHQALDQASVKVTVQVSAKIKTVLDEGGIVDGMPALKIAEFAIKQVMKCGDFLRHLAEEERKKQVVLTGRIEGLKDAMELVLKMRDAEVSKGQAASQAEAEGKPLRGRARPSGVRPGPSTAAQRKGATAAQTEAPPHSPAAEDAAREAHGSLAERRAKAKSEKATAAGTNGKPQKPKKKKASRKKVTARRKSAAR